jgi:hypothetical protein
MALRKTYYEIFPCVSERFTMDNNNNNNNNNNNRQLVKVQISQTEKNTPHHALTLC